MKTDPQHEIFRGQAEVGRWVGLVVFGGMTVVNAMQMPGLQGHWLAIIRWGLVTGLFALFTLSYLRRGKALALASRPIEICLPLVVVALPMVQASTVDAGWVHLPTWALMPFLPLEEGVREVLGLALMASGEALAVISMLWLGRSFSVFVEVRELVTRGPYRLMRHPLYGGELIAIWGYSLIWASAWSVTMAVVVTALQVWRARLEERKILHHIPAYAAYRTGTGFFWPLS